MLLNIQRFQYCVQVSAIPLQDLFRLVDSVAQLTNVTCECWLLLKEEHTWSQKKWIHFVGTWCRHCSDIIYKLFQRGSHLVESSSWRSFGKTIYRSKWGQCVFILLKIFFTIKYHTTMQCTDHPWPTTGCCWRLTLTLIVNRQFQRAGGTLVSTQNNNLVIILQ